MTTKLVSTGVEFPDATTQTTSGVPLTGGTMTGALTTTGFTSTGIDDNATSTAITIDANEKVLIGTTTPFSYSGIAPLATIDNSAGLGVKGVGNSNSAFTTLPAANTNYYPAFFLNSAGTGIGNIFCTGVSTTYNTGASGGIDFSGNANAAGMTSEVLDDYEEGTFVPTMLINNDSTGITYGYSFGTYTKIGRKVTVNLRITITNKGTNTGQVKIGGLPFAVGNTLNSTGYEAAVDIFTWNSLATNIYTLGGTAVESSSLLYLFGNNSAAGDIQDLPDTYLTNSTTFRMSCTYFT